MLCDANIADRDLCRLVFAGLTQFDENGKVVPHLAASWSIADGGASSNVTYTFKLADSSQANNRIASIHRVRAEPGLLWP